MDYIERFFPKLKHKSILKVSRFIVLGIIIAGYIFFLTQREFYTNVYTDYTEFFAWKKFIGTTVIFILMVVVLFLKNNLSDKANQRLNNAMMILIPLGIFFAIEYVNDTDLFNIKLYKVLLNILIIYLVLAFGFVISGSIKIGIILGTVVTCLFGLSCYYLYSFRNTPLLFSDFSDIATAGNVMQEYSYTLDFRTFIFIVACFFICLIACKLRSNKPLGWKKRVIALLIYMAVLAGTIYIVVISDHWNIKELKVSTFRPMSSYHKNGAYLTLVRSAKITIVTEPEDYSVNSVEKITEKYSAKYAAEEKTEEYRKPNVIVIMNESFADIQNIGEYFETNTEVLPFYNSLKENTIKGNVYASKIGGGTANSEFEFLTGNSLAFLPIGASPYQMFVKEPLPSLNTTLIAQGYQGIIALHPFIKSGYNRIKVYDLLDFNEFLGQEDIDEPILYRQYISDESNYDKIIQEYESAKSESDSPFYLFNVTMQNHGSYDGDYDNFPVDVVVTEEDFKPAEQGKHQEINKLLTLMNKSDQAVSELVEYFKKQDDDTIIIFFGDHQPKMPKAFYNRVLKGTEAQLTSEELMQKYKVPFFIWANFDIEEATYDKCSYVYLQSLAFEAAGMEMTDYQKYLLELRKEVPTITVFGHYDSDGKFYNSEDKIADSKAAVNPASKEELGAQTPQDSKLSEYNILVYNNLFDSKHRINSFFYKDEYEVSEK